MQEEDFYDACEELGLVVWQDSRSRAPFRGRLRTAAFDEAARILGLDGVRQVTTDYSGEAGARATRSMLTGAPPDRPTAIVYDNDIMAVAGLSVATRGGSASRPTSLGWRGTTPSCAG